MSRNALRSCLRSSSLRHSRVRFLSGFLSNSSIASISSCDVGASRFTCTATACTNASRAPGYSAKRASSSLVCTVFGTMTFLAKPSIGRSAALKIWQCASMMRSIRRADADCAEVPAGNAAAPTASAAPPATNSRRRMLTSSNAPQVGCYRAARYCPVALAVAVTEQNESVCIFFEHRLDAALPAAVEFLQELLGWRNAPRDIILDRQQITALVVAGGIQSSPPREPLARKRERRLRNFKRALPGDRGGEPELGHVIAKLLPLVGGPILDQAPGCVERGVIVEQPGPECR